MEIVYFALTAIGLYFAADWLLRLVERRLGRPLEHRGLVFFAILLASALVAFALIRHFLGT